MKLSDFQLLVREQVSPRTPDIMIDTIATQMLRAFEAGKRITDEGLVVRDLKGSIIPHPAIKIEADAQKAYIQVIDKCKVNRQ